MKEFANVTLFILMNIVFMNAQSTYEIYYDKFKDEYSFKKIRYYKGKPKIINLGNKAPALKRGDIVKVTVKNFNPFLYHVVIDQSEEFKEQGKSNSMFNIMGMLSGGLSPLSSFIGDLAGNQEDFSTSRGTEKLCSKQGMLDEYISLKKNSNKLVEEYENHLNEYNSVMNSIKMEDLHKNYSSVLDRLNQLKNEYYDPSNNLSNLLIDMKLYLNKAGITDYQNLEKQNQYLGNIEELIGKLHSSQNVYSIKSIEKWIDVLSKASFEKTASFEIGDEQTNTFRVDDDLDEVLTGLIYSIKFYRLDKLPDFEKTDAPKLKHIRYYHDGIYWNKKGEIDSVFCMDCSPVIKAEGLFDSDMDDIPRYYEDFYEDDRLPDAAVGDWVFYDEKGNVVRKDYAPFDYAFDGLENNSLPAFDFSDQHEAIEVARTLELPVSGAIVVNWATGFYFLGGFNERKDYNKDFIDGTDSFRVASTPMNMNRMAIGTQLALDFNGNKVISPSINFGVAVDFWDEKDINFILGGGIKFKKFGIISITAGLSLIRSNQLDKAFDEGALYDETDYDFDQDFQKKVYVPGWYVGLNVNF